MVGNSKYFQFIMSVNFMFRISRKTSVMLSTALSVVLFVGCLVCAFMLPTIVDLMIEPRDAVSATAVSATGKIVILALSYTALAVVICADVLMFLLLKNVRQSKVFTQPSVFLVRGVSWCCLLLSALFICLGFYFTLAFYVAFFIAFLALCLRVVKNVLEDATAIKSENDLTV